ncbi:MAG TPA: sigma-E factor negative regulatory protein [Lysobacter sp.]|nr:sigma-E factor negative regulatory protein [Lysobacter sp.]
MSTSQIHDAETLSALFDGQLRDDARRFALKRLGHDAQWRQACGRWQLAGDVLRGNAMAAAPAGFAERVMVAVAQEGLHADGAAPVLPASLPGKAHVRAHRRWIGGAALAASVAMAALFVVRPAFQAGDSSDALARQTVAVEPVAGDATSPVTSADVFAGSDAGLVETPASGSPVELPAKSPADGVGLALAAAVAVADVPRRAGERRARGQSQRAALRGSQNRQLEAATAVASATTPVGASVAADALAGSEVAAKSLHPFMPVGEIVSRPWPRAVLPGYSASGALTAGYHGAGEPSAALSFYPFEPQALQGHGRQSHFDQRRVEQGQVPLPEPAGTATGQPGH